MSYLECVHHGGTTMEPAEIERYQETAHEPISSAAGITMLRSTQQHHVQLSAMADLKANILITASSILLTFAITTVQDRELRAAMVVAAIFSLASLVLAVLAVLPSYRPEPFEEQTIPARFNLLFFGHFARIQQDRYIDEMIGVLKTGDEAVMRMKLKDIHQLGTYLADHKYRYLRLAYLAFITGIVSAASIQLLTLVF